MDANKFENIGWFLVRYGLVIVLGWIGLMKFTEYEANGIQGLVINSPFLSWTYQFLSVQALSTIIGVVEVGTAVLIALRPFAPNLSAIGSGLAALTFLMTLSFIITTPPVWEATLGGFPALSVVPGQFLLKDIVLFGAALLTMGEALKAVARAK